jgi:hypothetical protein
MMVLSLVECPRRQASVPAPASTLDRLYPKASAKGNRLKFQAVLGKLPDEPAQKVGINQDNLTLPKRG